MKAVVVHAKDDLRVDEVPEPTMSEDQVLVEMEWGGVCGSDVAYWRTGISGTATLRDPLILGHEGAGRVAEIGSEAAKSLPRDGITVGTPVALYPATLVGDFDVPADTASRTNLWPQVRYFGSAAFFPHEAGCFSRFRAVRADQLRLLPEGVSTKAGALAEPLAVALHAVNRAGDVRGARALVNGAGPIGALVIGCLRRRGARQIWAADISPPALEVATALGADHAVNPARGDELPQEMDVAFEASGVPATLGDVILSVRRGKVLVQVGNLPAGEVLAALGNIVTRELDYRGSYRFVDEMADAVQLLAEGLNVTPLMTHEFAIDDALRAFEIAEDHGTGSSKVLLRLS